MSLEIQLYARKWAKASHERDVQSRSESQRPASVERTAGYGARKYREVDSGPKCADTFSGENEERVVMRGRLASDENGAGSACSARGQRWVYPEVFLAGTKRSRGGPAEGHRAVLEDE